MTSPCLWRRWVRISTLKCSCQTECTVLASAGLTPWMNLWSITRKRPSSPANMGRSCTWSERCCDLHTLTPTLDTHTHTHALIHQTLMPLPDCLNSSLSSGPSCCGVRTTSRSALAPPRLICPSSEQVKLSLALQPSRWPEDSQHCVSKYLHPSYTTPCQKNSIQ